MSVIAEDIRKAIQIALPLVGALIVVSAARAPAQAATNHMLVIPASDGYGFDDCLSSGKPCGQVIADAWCEAHGLTASVSFGRAEDITAAIPADKRATGKTSPVDIDAFIVNCRD